MGNLIILFLCSLSLYLLSILIKFLHEVWWMPIHIQQVMESQGIKGPSYKFIYGNTKEIFNMKEKSMNRSMGLSHYLLPRIQPHTYAWMKIYGNSFLQWNGSKAELVVTDSDLIKEILHNRDDSYVKSDAESIYLKKIFGGGIVESEGEKWTKLRRLADYAFHGERLKGMTQAMIDSVEMLLERWKHHEGREIDVNDEFGKLTSDVISRTAFGSNSLEGKHIFDMLRKIATIVSRNSYKIRMPGLSKILKNADDIESDKLQKGIRNSIIGIVQGREKANNGEVNSFGSDFLGLLVNAKHDANASYRLSLDDIINECKTFYAAGSGTTANLLTWTVLLLAFHTDWQEKARQEVLELFGKEHPTSEGIGRLKIMSMIINETLRLYPSAITIKRKVNRDLKLGELSLPGNINVCIPVLALHTDPQIWGEDAHLFRPDRFSEGIAKASSNKPAAFLSFGLGPRSCVGMNFATNEAKISLSMILQHYAFTPSPNYIHSPVDLVSVRPRHGVQVILHAL